MGDIKIEQCSCFSIVRDNDGRLQCLKHGDVTERRAEPNLHTPDWIKNWSSRNN